MAKTIELPEFNAFIEQVVNEASHSSVPLFTVIDVGATNVRFSLTTSFTTVAFIRSTARSAPELRERLQFVAETLASKAPQLLSRIAGGAIAVPGPVTDGAYAVIANYAGKTAAEKTVRIDELPAAILPVGRRVMLNDLEAAATGIAAIDAAGLLSNMFSVMWESKTNPLSAQSLSGACRAVVLAPGTGLGCALILGKSDGGLEVLPLEFGHTNVSRREDALEAFAKVLGRELEYDDVCSGRGVEFLYDFYASNVARAPGSPGVTSTRDIAARLRAGNDASSHRAFLTHYRLTVQLASQLTMGFMATHIIIAGDNAIANGPFLEANRERLHKEFMTHSMERYGFMSRASGLRQTGEVNLNLIGCAYAAYRLAAAKISKL